MERDIYISNYGCSFAQCDQCSCYAIVCPLKYNRSALCRVCALELYDTKPIMTKEKVKTAIEAILGDAQIQKELLSNAIKQLEAKIPIMATQLDVAKQIYKEKMVTQMTPQDERDYQLQQDILSKLNNELQSKLQELISIDFKIVKCNESLKRVS